MRVLVKVQVYTSLALEPYLDVFCIKLYDVSTFQCAVCEIITLQLYSGMTFILLSTILIQCC